MLGTLLVFFLPYFLFALFLICIIPYLPYFLLIIFVLLIGNGSVGIDLILRDGKDDATKRAVNGFCTTGNRHILKIVIENNGAVHPYHVEEALTLTKQFLAALIEDHVIGHGGGGGSSKLWERRRMLLSHEAAASLSPVCKAASAAMR